MGGRYSDSSSSDESSGSSRSNNISIRSDSTRRSSFSDTDSESIRSDDSRQARPERSLARYHPEYSYQHGARERGTRKIARNRDHRIQPFRGQQHYDDRYSDSHTSSSSSDAESTVTGFNPGKKDRDNRRAGGSDRLRSSSKMNGELGARNQLTSRRDINLMPVRGASDSDTSLSDSSGENPVNNQPRSRPSLRSPEAVRRMMFRRNGPGRYPPPRRPGHRRSGLIGGLITARNFLDGVSHITGFMSRVLGGPDAPGYRRPPPRRSYNYRQNVGKEPLDRHPGPYIPPGRTLGTERSEPHRYLQN